MSNPTAGSNVVVTSPGHGLRSGFVVRISGARGRKTNDAKNQVNEDGNVTAPGAGLIIESAANGFYEITNVTIDTFELLGKSGNCDFISEGTAKWSTGRAGSGYSKDAFVSFVGGGGQGALDCKVQNGSFLHYHNQPRFRLRQSSQSQGSFGGGGDWGLEELLTMIFLFLRERILLVRNIQAGFLEPCYPQSDQAD